MTNPTNPFAPPAKGSMVDWADLLGSLLIIDVEGVEHDIPTVHGNAENVVKATVTVVDGAKAGEVYPNTLIFPLVLVSSLSPRVGSKVLARLTQGEAKPGKSAPWVLNDPTEEDVAAGIKAMQASTAPSGGTAPAPSEAPSY